jgi:uncharacterized protein (DUF58 family)
MFIGAFAMLGGALRGFNLLLVLAGLLVAALIMQWRWSRRSIEAMSVRRRLPSEAFAGRSFRVRYLLHNHSRYMPAWMIRVEDKISAVDKNLDAVAVCGAGVVPAGNTVITPCDCVVQHRGRYRFGPMRIVTSFPFALFTSSETVDTAEEVYVFPRILALQPRWRERLRSRSGGVSTTARRSGPVEGDFFGLREWQTGDSPKWIHWRTTARINELAVRQFEQQRRFDTCILVDAYSGEDDPSEMDRVESAISLAATFLVNLVGSPSNRIVLAVAGRSSDTVMGGGSDLGKRRMLKALAEVTPSDAPQLAEAVGKAMRMVGYTQHLVVLSPRSMQSAQRDEESTRAAISHWVRRGSLQWIDVNRELEGWVRNEPGDARSRPSDVGSQGALDTRPQGAIA